LEESKKEIRQPLPGADNNYRTFQSLNGES